jgi:uncharacterized protein
MPLTFNLRHLEKRNLHLTGELPPGDLDAEGLDELITLQSPLQYDLTLERLSNSVLVHGYLAVMLECECARCLKKFQKWVRLDPWNADLPLTGEEKVAVDNDCVDLTPLIREDILLAFPQHPLCEIDCSGLPKSRQKPVEQGNGASQSVEVSSPWAELNKLKF